MVVQLNIEVEEDFKLKLKQLAKAEDRTLTAFTLRILRDAVRDREVKA
jgi:predicted transcriptional regulator